MIKKFKILLTLLLLLAVLYAIGPILAAMLRVGDREGPTIYARGYHEGLYKLTYETVHGGTPRMPFSTILYDRPFFYGLARPPKSERWRREILKAEGDGPVYELLKAIDERLKRED